MKKSTIKKRSEEELMMAKAVCDFHPFARNSVLMDKGDMKAPNHLLNWEDNFTDLEDDKDVAIPMKDMKRANRRKATFHKHQQRERQYRNLGFFLERFSEADLGKMKEGTGMFPETQHQYSMYNRGEKKGEKPITTKQAISMMEHERWLDEQDAIAEEDEAERLFMMNEMESLMQEVRWLNLRLQELMEHMNDLNISINSMKSRKYDCLKMIEKMQEVLNK
jgi:hypothetical protein